MSSRLAIYFLWLMGVNNDRPRCPDMCRFVLSTFLIVGFMQVFPAVTFSEPPPVHTKRDGKNLCLRQPDGPFEEREDGFVWSKGACLEEYMHGLWVFYHHPGNVRVRVGAFNRGKRIGKWTFWRDDGVKFLEEHYSDDLKDGSYVNYHPNGSVRLQGAYRAEYRVGKWYRYEAWGEVAEVCLYNKTGEKEHCELGQ